MRGHVFFLRVLPARLERLSPPLARSPRALSASWGALLFLVALASTLSRAQAESPSLGSRDVRHDVASRDMAGQDVSGVAAWSADLQAPAGVGWTSMETQGTADDPMATPTLAALPAGPKSPGVAFAWAFGATLVGWGMAGTGIAIENAGLFFLGEAVSAVGPSAGHFYAGESSHGIMGSVVRGIGLLSADIGLVMAFQGSFDGSSSSEDSGAVLFYTGLAVSAGLGLYDWIDAPRAAQRANSRAVLELGLAPLAPGQGGSLALALTRRF